MINNQAGGRTGSAATEVAMKQTIMLPNVHPKNT
jgi:hypothetical protein